ncbi:DUF309 domain-containing protein [Jeotgalibacillus sp. S-D1]|uniref:DUF309 domain-containing protein n=1 Tax=Jeotgalibacillus sp. S-D1 TaxID=2552189 RepID=UPI001059F08E|nr:DUF309 domain-containing protein [Jeotgalibacillus sp. S-D1]TDL34690.1 DUF309 domain-containing protein [Jeotgalibacillus sp. S-D1]
MKSAYPQAFIDYLVHFHGDRDYFECHEVLEEYWKENTPMEKDSIWVGWIQLAVALYHQRRNNFNGAKRTIEKAITKFRLHEEQLHLFGINPQIFLEDMQALSASISAKSPYTSLQLPLADPFLTEVCINECKKKGFQWGSHSDLSDKMIVDRHRLRDRKEVILLRKQALHKRKNH